MNVSTFPYFDRDKLIESFRCFLCRTDRPDDVRSNILDVIDSQGALLALDVINRSIQQKFSSVSKTSDRGKIVSERKNLTRSFLRYLPNAIYKVKAQYHGSSIDFHFIALSWLQEVLKIAFTGEECDENTKRSLTDPPVCPKSLLLFQDQMEALLGTFLPVHEDKSMEILRVHILPWLFQATQNALVSFRDFISKFSNSSLSIYLDAVGETFGLLLTELRKWEFLISACDMLLLFTKEILPVIRSLVHEISKLSDYAHLTHSVFYNLILPVQTYSAVVGRLLYQDNIIVDMGKMFQSSLEHLVAERSDFSTKLVTASLLFFENILAQSLYLRNLIQSRKTTEKSSDNIYTMPLDNIKDSLYVSFRHILYSQDVCCRFISLIYSVVSNFEEDHLTSNMFKEIAKKDLVREYKQIFIASHYIDRRLLLEHSLLPAFLLFLWQEPVKNHVRMMYTVYQIIRELLSHPDETAGNRLYQAVLLEMNGFYASLSGEAESPMLNKFLKCETLRYVQEQSNVENSSTGESVNRLKLRQGINRSRPIEIIFQLAEKFEISVRRQFQTLEGSTVYAVKDVSFCLFGSMIFSKYVNDEHFERISLTTLFQRFAILGRNC